MKKPDNFIAIHKRLIRVKIGGGKTIDHDPRTRWSSLGRDQEWLAIDLGEQKTIDRLTLAWETAHASYEGRC